MADSKPIDFVEQLHAGQERLSASQMNAIINYVLNLSRTQGQGTGVNSQGANIAIPFGLTQALGVIHNLGPSGEADRTDNTYWVRFAEITDTDVADFFKPTFAPILSSAGGIVLATNIGEPSVGSRGMVVGDPVQLTLWRNARGANRWIFSAGISSPILIRISDPVPIFNTENRWTYTGTEVRRTIASAGSPSIWQVKPGGFVGSDLENCDEAFNDGADIESNGVDISLLTIGDFEFKPIRGNPVRQLVKIPTLNLSNGGVTYTYGFTKTNCIDGTCG